MSLRIIAGASGQGKTAGVLGEVIRRSMEQPDKNFFLIVPEQFSLEMQQKLIDRHPDHGYFNIDVLSFYRLAYRIFDECGVQPKDILEDLGVSLILRRILSEHEEEFPFFKKNIRKAGFIDELKSMLMELIAYGVTWEQLQAVKGKLEGQPVLETKCGEIGKIFEYFDKEIAGSFMVAEQILEVVSALVPASRMLRDSVFYFDGFTGFTPVQLTFLRELLQVSEQINVSVTMEGEPFAQRPVGSADSADRLLFQKGQSGHTDRISGGGADVREELFYFSRKTLHSLATLCRETGTPLEDPVVLRQDPPPRFGNPELAFLERHLFRRQAEPYEGAVRHLHLTVCRNPEMEAEYVLHKVEQMVRRKGYRYRDFAVLAGNVDEYASAFRRKAEILHIPLFVDTKKKVSYHPGVETLRAMFHLAASDYSYESVFRYLKSGMSDFTDAETDFLENYVIWAGIRGYHMWKDPFVRRMAQVEESREEKLQALRVRLLEETAEITRALRDRKKTVREQMEALYYAMCRLHYYEKLERLAEEAEAEGEYVRGKEHRQLFARLVELLDKLAAVFGEERIPAAELEEIFNAGLDALELGAPPLTADALILGDLKRTRLPDIQVLFIAGMNDGKVPPSQEDGGMLNDDEKQILEENGIALSLCMEEQSLEDEFYMYLAFTKPRQELWFTLSAQDGGGAALSPSPLLKECTRIFPALLRRSYPGEETRYYFNEADSREMLIAGLRELDERTEAQETGERLSGKKAFRMLLAYWMNHENLRRELLRLWEEKKGTRRKGMLPAELMRELFGRELKGSVTRLERFAACPYQYYCIYGLEIREREEYRVRAADLGNMFHRALEIFSGRVRQSGYRWKNLPEEMADAWIREAVQEAAGEENAEVLYSSARNQYKLQVVDRILKRTVRVLKMHLEHSQMEPDRFELHFGRTDQLKSVHLPLKDGNRMQLEGCIDRVDVCEEDDRILLRIIDYKSGIQTFDINDLYHGLQIQLVIYMDAAAEIYGNETGKEAVPAGMFYYTLKDPVIKAESGAEDLLRTSFRMSGYANSDADVLQKLEEGQENFVSASIRLTKKGVPYKNAAVLDTDDFRSIGRYVRRKITEMGEEIYEGKITVSPYRNERGTACDYCPYGAVCGFDPDLPQYEYRDFKKESAACVMETIREEENQEWER